MSYYIPNINHLKLEHVYADVLEDQVRKQLDRDMIRAKKDNEQLGSQKAHCPKCGDEVLSDEDGLCGHCV